MAKKLNGLKDVVGIEFNTSCPNTDPFTVDFIIRVAKEIKKETATPLLLKLGFGQPYLVVAQALEGIVEAISINSVPWAIGFLCKPSPLAKYGGGGVSGKAARFFTWKMVKDLAKNSKIPVIGPGIWSYDDIKILESLGASAFHFGAIFLRWPWKPTAFVKRWRREH